MEYLKLTPGIAIKNGIKLNVLPATELEGVLFQDIDSHHLHHIEQNLYLASLLGNSPAKLTLAYMLKNGVGTDKNCSAALAYYLSDLRETKVEIFEFPSDYQDAGNF